MLKVAITGNIASGKSLFESFLKNLGFKVLCLDNVTHLLYENSDVLKDFLLKKFNTISRAEISKKVFKNPSLKSELEKAIYPLILDEMEKFFIENKSEKYVFVSAAVLFEAGFKQYFDKIIFIKADENIRLQRLMDRNNLSKDEAKIRIKSQKPEDEKIKLSDFVIDNSGTVLELENAANAFISKLSAL